MTDDRFSWIPADVELATRLASVWPTWVDAGEDGLAAVLDRQPDWAGWDDWSDAGKQAGLARLLDAWFPAEAEPGADVDRVAWVRADVDLADRLTANWPGWDSPGDGGLAPFLDQQPDWAGWDAWEPGPRREYLARALDAWYPPDGEPATETDPLGWVRADTALVTRLDECWPTWAQPDDSGLLAVLNGTPEWAGWAAWDAGQQRSYLARTLDAWYPPVDTAPPVPTAAADEAHTELAAALNEALATVPGAADLSNDDIRRILTEVLTEELAAHTPATPKAG